jgi:hypothetical protein
MTMARGKRKPAIAAPPCVTHQRTAEPGDIRNASELARPHAAEVIARLLEWVRGEDPRTSIEACNALLDRGFGKVGPAVEGNGPPTIRHEDALALLD